MPLVMVSSASPRRPPLPGRVPVLSRRLRPAGPSLRASPDRSRRNKRWPLFPVITTSIVSSCRLVTELRLLCLLHRRPICVQVRPPSSRRPLKPCRELEASTCRAKILPHSVVRLDIPGLLHSYPSWVMFRRWLLTHLRSTTERMPPIALDQMRRMLPNSSVARPTSLSLNPRSPLVPLSAMSRRRMGWQDRISSSPSFGGPTHR